MELRGKALELAEHLNNLGIITFENLEILAKQDFEHVVYFLGDKIDISLIEKEI